MNIIETIGLSHTYGINTPFERVAVDNVSLTVQNGEFLGIIGHTGSGKSTFVQMLNGLIKPTSGKVLLDGKDIWENPKELKNVRFKIGMVFQYPEYQLFEETVFKDISFGPKNMGLDEKRIKELVLQAADFVGLNRDLLLKSPFELSGGEKRRAAIAGVMAMDPDVLILDEPTAGLDPKGRDVLLAQIVGYHKQRKNTVLFVSHSMEDIARIADRVLVINDSKAVMLDSTRRVFSRADELENMGLRVPQITKITSELRKLGYDLPDGILTVEDGFRELIGLFNKRGAC